MDLKGKKVTVMGVGMHGGGLGVITWLVDQGADITATDMKTEEELGDAVSKMRAMGDIKIVLGGHREEDFTDADLVVRNPAVRRDSEFLELARKNNIPIEMDSTLFFQYAPTKDVVGVTGSKGKTTTSTAITTVLQSINVGAVAVGIDGVSPLGHMREIHEDVPVVFEISSWRLEAMDVAKISPPIAVMTSLYREHLNTYDSFEEYIDTKKVIFRHQDENGIVLLNWDDARLRTWKNDVKGKLYWYGLTEMREDGIFVKEGNVTVRREGQEQTLFSVAELPVHFEQERRNLLPATLIGLLRGLTPEQLLLALKKFKPLKHRLEVVRELDGVTYINDSAATMPDATVAALRAMQGRPLVLILGGNDKELQFDALGGAVAVAGVRSLVWLPGDITDTMKTAFQKAGVDMPAYDAPDMSSAVAMARSLAQSGDTVLLSPGATSFALFKHEFDRGDKFREAVVAL